MREKHWHDLVGVDETDLASSKKQEKMTWMEWQAALGELEFEEWLLKGFLVFDASLSKEQG